MQIALPTDVLDGYTSNSQRARVSTEAWGAGNLYCPACESPRLDSSPVNSPAIDFVCPSCLSSFQLKSQSRPIGSRILDSAYSQMKRAILADQTPNLYVLEYDRVSWSVRNVLLIPRFAFSLSAIERRKPLAPTAERANWVGCNILLSGIALDARIPVLSGGRTVPVSSVRDAYNRIRPFERLPVEKRGWTLDVLNIVRSLGRKQFVLADVYAAEKTLAAIHPGNRHVRDKIRQQLQILRDMGLLEFLGAGSYRIK